MSHGDRAGVSIADIESGLSDVRRRIELACLRTGRKSSEVTVVGVTKKHPPELISAAYAAGIVDVGENYVQELQAKQQAVELPVRWHFIGHLQRNKVRAIIPFVSMIHAVDSVRLGREIDKQARAIERNVPVLLQVNTSGEESKHGVEPAEAAELAAELAQLKNVELRGLMTLAAWLDDPEATRPMFKKLRQAREQCQQRIGEALPLLSMGMTNDFDVAVEEGATHVRIGTALFGSRG